MGWADPNKHYYYSEQEEGRHSEQTPKRPMCDETNNILFIFLYMLKPEDNKRKIEHYHRQTGSGVWAMGQADRHYWLGTDRKKEPGSDLIPLRATMGILFPQPCIIITSRHSLMKNYSPRQHGDKAISDFRRNMKRPMRVKTLCMKTWRPGGVDSVCQAQGGRTPNWRDIVGCAVLVWCAGYVQNLNL